MNIVLITPLLQPYRISFYSKLQTSLKPDSFRVFFSEKKVDDGRPQYEGATEFDTKGFPEKNYIVLGFNIKFNPGMYKSIKKYKPDIIITQGIPGNLTYRKIVKWAKKSRVKIVFWYCGWEPNIPRNIIFKKIKNILAKTYYKKGDFFLTYSSKARTELIQQGFNQDIIEIAYNGIEIDNYKHNEKLIIKKGKELRKNYSQFEKIYLYVGGLSNSKRILFLISAFKEFSKRNKNVCLWIIGDGPQKAELLSLIHQNKNIVYFGRIIKGVEPYFSAADFFVLPGTGGLALNQAMFFRTPCIVGRADGTEDDLVLEGITGFRFEEDDELSLLNSLQKSIEIDNIDLKQMGIFCNKLIKENFHVDNMIKKFSEVINKYK